MAAGYTTSFGAGDFDALVLRLDPGGRVLWQRAYGGWTVDAADWVEETSDGGFIVAGATGSFDNGWVHPWLFKLDPSGNIAWQKSYGGTGGKGGGGTSTVHQTLEGGFVVGGSIRKDAFSFQDAWVLRLDSEGNVLWQRVYGGQMPESSTSIE